MPSSCRLSAPSVLLLVLLVLMAAVGSGCALQLGRDVAPTRTYWLTPPLLEVKAHLHQVDVTAVPGLDTDQMLALDGDNRLAPYAGARWNGAIPQLLRSLVERSMDGGVGEQTLRIEVRRFFVERDAGEHGVATVEFAATLLQHADPPRLFVAREPVREQRLGAVAAAFQRAVDETITGLAAWVRERSEEA